MNEFIEQILLAGGGYAFHLLKQYQESIKRKEDFITKMMVVSVLSNILSILLLINVGKQLPPDLIVMSPFTCIIIGYFGSSMLSGFINVKKPNNEKEKTTRPPRTT